MCADQHNHPLAQNCKNFKYSFAKFSFKKRFVDAGPNAARIQSKNTRVSVCVVPNSIFLVGTVTDVVCIGIQNAGDRAQKRFQTLLWWVQAWVRFKIKNFARAGAGVDLKLNFVRLRCGCGSKFYFSAGVARKIISVRVRMRLRFEELYRSGCGPQTN